MFSKVPAECPGESWRHFGIRSHIAIENLRISSLYGSWYDALHEYARTTERFIIRKCFQDAQEHARTGALWKYHTPTTMVRARKSRIQACCSKVGAALFVIRASTHAGHTLEI